MTRTLPSGYLQTNCYLYSGDQRHLFIIDPADEASRIIREARATGLIVSGIILTHSHFDHILACREVAAAFDLPGVYLHPAEASMMGLQGKRNQEQSVMRLVPALKEHIQPFLSDLPEPIPVGDRHLIEGSDLEVLHTPGHTAGSICLYSRESQVLFSGDTLFAGSVGRTDFPGGDHRLLIGSIRYKLLCLPDETRVYPGHGQETSIGVERITNTFLKGIDPAG